MQSRIELRKNFYAIVYSRGMVFNLLCLAMIVTFFAVAGLFPQ